MQLAAHQGHGASAMGSTTICSGDAHDAYAAMFRGCLCMYAEYRSQLKQATSSKHLVVQCRLHYYRLFMCIGNLTSRKIEKWMLLLSYSTIWLQYSAYFHTFYFLWIIGSRRANQAPPNGGSHILKYWIVHAATSRASSLLPPLYATSLLYHAQNHTQA